MKPFNLQEALTGKPVVTRDGRPVTKITNFGITDYPLVGVLGKEIEGWRVDGSYCPPANTRKDLFMAPEKKEGWVNLYRPNDPEPGRETFAGAVYPTEERARAMCMQERLITRIKISWEE